MAINFFGLVNKCAGALLIALGMIFINSAMAADNKYVTVGNSPGTAVLDISTAAACEPTLIEHFSRYLIHALPLQESGKHLVVKQEFEVGKGCFEGFEPARVTVTANPIDVNTGTIDPHALWAFNTEGISGEEESWDMAGLYRVEMPGCCAGEQTSKYYSLDTGKLVGSSTAKPLEASFPGGEGKKYNIKDRRYITVESNLASSPQGIPGAMATIFYGDRLGLKEKVSISLKSGSDHEGWSAQQFDFIDHNPSNMVLENTTHKLRINMVCQCNKSPFDVVVPVTLDGINEKAATITGRKDVVLKKLPAAIAIHSSQSTHD